MERTRRLAVVGLCLLAPAVEACTRCRPLVRAAVYGAEFVPNLGLVLLPLPLLVLAAALVGRLERDR